MTRLHLDQQDEEQPISEEEVGQAVVDVVKQGVQDGRMACGTDQCVQLLSSSQSAIMFCFLAKSAGSQSPDIKIKQELLQAFCYENDIDFVNIQNGQDTVKDLVQSCQDPTATKEHNTFSKPLAEETEKLSDKRSVEEEETGLKQATEIPTARQEHERATDLRQATEVPTARQQHEGATMRPVAEAMGGQLTQRKGFSLKVPVDETPVGVSATGENDLAPSVRRKTVQPEAGDDDLAEAPGWTRSSGQSGVKSDMGACKPAPEDNVDYGCIMIKYPGRGKSQEDDLVSHYVNRELRKYLEPCVTLPVWPKVPAAQLQHPQLDSTQGGGGEADRLAQGPSPDIGQWTMVKLKNKYKTEAN